MTNTYKTPCEQYPQEFEFDENGITIVKIVKKEGKIVTLQFNPLCDDCFTPEGCIEQVRLRLSELIGADVEYIPRKKN